jgi:hypothetical protein
MTLDTEPQATEPLAEADLSTYVLTMLDAHLAAMRAVRDRLRVSGTITAGSRRSMALDSVALAERYAAGLTRALAAPQV